MHINTNIFYITVNSWRSDTTFSVDLWRSGYISGPPHRLTLVIP